MARPFVLTLVCLLVVGALAVGAGSAQSSDPATIGTPDQFTSTTFTVEVAENGSARWTFSYYTPTLNDSERSQFLTFAERFESEETDLWRNFQDRAAVLTDAGTDTTGRNMSAEAFQREATLDQSGNRGVVRMSFRWTAFGAVDGDRVVVSDVFEGMFYVAEDQWLVFEAGPGLDFVAEEIDPPPEEYSGSTLADSESITWTGERQFTDGKPRVVFTSAEAVVADTETTGGDVTTDGQDTTPATAAGDGGASGSMLLVALALLLVGIGALAVWRSGLVGDTGATEGGATDAADPSAPGETPDEEGVAQAGAGAAGTAIGEEDLLTDEDRVISLLEDNGGRMQQAKIVEETGWSKSKVSMLLSDMADEEQISKLRVGRENIISLSGHEPDAAGSPFDDE